MTEDAEPEWMVMMKTTDAGPEVSGCIEAAEKVIGANEEAARWLHTTATWSKRDTLGRHGGGLGELRRDRGPMREGSRTAGGRRKRASTWRST